MWACLLISFCLVILQHKYEEVLKVLCAQIRKSACLLFLLGFYQKREREELLQYLLAAQGCDFQMEGQTEISLCHDWFPAQGHSHSTIKRENTYNIILLGWLNKSPMASLWSFMFMQYINRYLSYYVTAYWGYLKHKDRSRAANRCTAQKQSCYSLLSESSKSITAPPKILSYDGNFWWKNESYIAHNATQQTLMFKTWRVKGFTRALSTLNLNCSFLRVNMSEFQRLLKRNIVSTNVQILVFLQSFKWCRSKHTLDFVKRVSLYAAHLFAYKWERIFHRGILESDGHLLLLLTWRT